MDDQRTPPNDPSDAQSETNTQPADKPSPNDLGEVPSRLKAGISPKRLEANRRNAKKSTGPITQYGKDRSRLNAVKNGFFAKQVIASSKVIGEKSVDFQRLVRDLQREWEPQTRLEALLVEQIALTLWMSRRLLRDCLQGQSVLGLDNWDINLARYETMLHNRSHRALADLERLQRQRKGESGE